MTARPVVSFGSLGKVLCGGRPFVVEAFVQIRPVEVKRLRCTQRLVAAVVKHVHHWRRLKAGLMLVFTRYSAETKSGFRRHELSRFCSSCNNRSMDRVLPGCALVGELIDGTTDFDPWAN